MDDKARRVLWRKWNETGEARHAAWAKRGFSHPPPPANPMPAECEGMECGAKTRAGTPCKRRDIYRSGRCKFHRGMSTGPRTPEGKARSARNG
jgi:hypothetical protein